MVFLVAKKQLCNQEVCLSVFCVNQLIKKNENQYMSVSSMIKCYISLCFEYYFLF